MLIMKWFRAFDLRSKSHTILTTNDRLETVAVRPACRDNMFHSLCVTVHTDNLFALLFLTLAIGELHTAPVHVMYERFQQNNGTDLIDAANLRIRKYNRTLTVFDGTFELYRDMDDDYAVSSISS
uniref:uncharacterized protein LOC120950887 n=1 Tax=Anopheles coluzzii TaxID=1518534 RepID=UPI0020FFEB37|nr:uncharacterized protein LOC120950887 [Anopheles coluzzii]